MNLNSRIFIAGHRGMVGSAIVRRLTTAGFTSLLTATRSELDLRDQAAVEVWFRANQPEYVLLAAGTVGGIMASSTRPAEFIYDNIVMQTTVVHAAHAHGVKKLLSLGSACIYPRDCPQPIKEEYLLTGPLEPTNESYAVAKIAGISLCQSYRKQYGSHFIAAMPTNLYGLNDNFDPAAAHVVPALIRKFHHARIRGDETVTIWGTGRPRREFMHVDDLADACLFLMQHYDDAEHINIGTGDDVTIGELAEIVRQIVYPDVTLVFDDSKPDGMPRRLLDVSRLRALGWCHSTGLRDGIARTYDWYVSQPEMAVRT